LPNLRRLPHPPALIRMTTTYSPRTSHDPFRAVSALHVISNPTNPNIKKNPVSHSAAVML
jgi:hypothetical protein